MLHPLKKLQLQLKTTNIFLKHITNINSRSQPRAMRKSQGGRHNPPNKNHIPKKGGYPMYTRLPHSNLSINTGNRGELDLIESSRGGHGDSLSNLKFGGTPSAPKAANENTPSTETSRDGGLRTKSKSTYHNYISNYIQYKSHM